MIGISLKWPTTLKLYNVTVCGYKKDGMDRTSTTNTPARRMPDTSSTCWPRMTSCLTPWERMTVNERAESSLPLQAAASW